MEVQNGMYKNQKHYIVSLFNGAHPALFGLVAGYCPDSDISKFHYFVCVLAATILNYICLCLHYKIATLQKHSHNLASKMCN